MNEDLSTLDLTNPESAAGTVITIPMKGQQFGGAGSAHVPEGNYQLRVKQALLQKTKSGTGVNVKTTFAIEGPPGGPWVGKRIVQYIPIPIGSPDSAEFGKRLWNLQNLFASIASAQGKLEQVRALESLSVPVSQLVGSLCFAHLADNEYEGRVSSTVGYYMDATQYAAETGPANGAATRTQSVAQQAAPAAQAAPAKAADPVDIFGG